MRCIREFLASDIDQMINYFLDADDEFLKGMGVEPNKLLPADQWRQIVLADLNNALEQKAFYYVIWELDGVPVGHSNINKIIYGQEACVHLHLWRSLERNCGYGTDFIRQSISRYFALFHLQYLVCEPYALNPAPNRTLPKVRFELVDTDETTPGWINFHQLVNQWILTREKWIETSNLFLANALNPHSR